MHAPAYGSVSHRVAWSALCVVPHSYGYVVENFNSTRSNVLHHCRTSPFRLTPRVVRRLCVAAQRNPWAPRGRSRGPGDKRGAPARCLVLYRREPKRPKPVRDEAETTRSRSAYLLEHLYFAHIACLYCSHPPHCVSLFESMYARRWGCIARLACWSVVLSTGSSASDFARHTFRLTPRVVRRLCVAAQRNPWAPRGRSRVSSSECLDHDEPDRAPRCTSESGFLLLPYTVCT